MPLYLRKSALRRVGEWFLAVRAKANSWMVIFGVMVVCWAVVSYILCWAACLCTGKKNRIFDQKQLRWNK